MRTNPLLSEVKQDELIRMRDQFLVHNKQSTQDSVVICYCTDCSFVTRYNNMVVTYHTAIEAQKMDGV